MSSFQCFWEWSTWVASKCRKHDQIHWIWWTHNSFKAPRFPMLLGMRPFKGLRNIYLETQTWDTTTKYFTKINQISSSSVCANCPSVFKFVAKIWFQSIHESSPRGVQTCPMVCFYTCVVWGGKIRVVSKHGVSAWNFTLIQQLRRTTTLLDIVTKI